MNYNTVRGAFPGFARFAKIFIVILTKDMKDNYISLVWWQINQLFLGVNYETQNLQ